MPMVSKNKYPAFSQCLIALALFVGVGCTSSREGSRPSVLIIAIDDWSSTGQECADDIEAGILPVLCQEANRFTHAYTPSTMTVPTLASIFTGLYPYENGVRHNGQFLLNKFVTLPEQAVDRGYRTGFFSGGQPVLRRSGLNQGFETFDDTVSLRPAPYRRANDVAQSFMSWHSQLTEPYFAVLYFTDLQFPEVSGVGDVGDLRGAAGRWQEINEALMHVHQQLATAQEWDNTVVMLFGTHGSETGRLVPHPELNVHREMTQVPLWIKPTYAKRDTRSFRSLDFSVSLVDLGPTLAEILEASITSSRQAVYSLRAAMKAPGNSGISDRIIISESAWGFWRGFSEIRVALRKSDYLLVADEPPRFFNVLSDSSETSPIPSRDSLGSADKAQLRTFAGLHGFAGWNEPADRLIDEFGKLPVLEAPWLSADLDEGDWQACLRRLQNNQFKNADCGDGLIRLFLQWQDLSQTTEARNFSLETLLDSLQLLVQRRSWLIWNAQKNWIWDTQDKAILNKIFLERMLQQPRFANAKLQLEARLKALL